MKTRTKTVEQCKCAK